jgi:hypothetical protein
MQQEDVKAVHREPHPFIGLAHIPHFFGKPVAFVGKVDRVEENTLYLKTAEGKYNQNKRKLSIFLQMNNINEKCAKVKNHLNDNIIIV